MARGLRERKKRQTHESIQRAALRLFAQRGFQATTIAAIAEAADVAPRTVSMYFPTKDDLLFPPDAAFDEMAERLEAREPGETTLQAFRDWVAESVATRASDPGLSDDRRLARTRRAIIDADPALRQRERGHMEHAEALLAAAIAEDSGERPEDLRPAMAAAATVAAMTILDRTTSDDDTAGPSAADVLALVDRIIRFAEAGMAALER